MKSIGTALQLATVALRMPHGDRTSTLDRLLQLEQSLRERQALLAALVLSGEIVSADIVLDGVSCPRCGLEGEALVQPRTGLVGTRRLAGAVAVLGSSNGHVGWTRFARSDVAAALAAPQYSVRIVVCTSTRG